MMFGELNSEKLLKEKQVVRQLVSEIGEIPLSQRQHVMLIYELALRLESVQMMQELSSHIKELCPEAFISSERSL